MKGVEGRRDMRWIYIARGRLYAGTDMDRLEISKKVLWDALYNMRLTMLARYVTIKRGLQAYISS